MAKFRKRPVVIDAVQFTREMAEGSETLPPGVQLCRRQLGQDKRFPEHMKDHWPNYEGFHKHVIKTLEGDMQVEIGDWVITGVKGERYPCKPDIFAATYDHAPECETNKELAS
jgi:hypothetical protein